MRRWVRTILVIAFVVACGRDAEKTPERAPAVPAIPPDAAITQDEVRGRRLCSRLVSVVELAALAKVDELAMAAGFSAAGDGQMRCLFLWPATGTPDVTVELRVDCRTLRPSVGDLEAHWADAGATRQGDSLARQPGPGVHQVFRDLSAVPCHLSVTTGFVAGEVASGVADLAARGLSPELAAALGPAR